MDNDIQVNQQLTRAKENFLSVPFSHEPAGGEIYDLEKEFSGTRKNKSYFVTFLMLAFLGVVTAGVWILYTTVEAQNENFEVQVADFEALRIREAFDALQKDRSLVAELARDIQRIQDEYRREEERLSLDLKARRETVLQSGSEDSQDLAAQLERENRRLLAEISGRYLPQLDEKQRAIQELEQKVKAQEAELEPVLTGREAFSNNQQKLFDRQKEDLVKFYEDRLARQRSEWSRIVQQQERSRAALIKAMNDRRQRELSLQEIKFNPLEERQEYQTLMDRVPGRAAVQVLTLPDTLIREGVLTKDLLEGISSEQRNQLFLLARLKEIPYVNSVPGLLRGVETLAQDVFSGADLALAAVEVAVVEKNRVISDLEQSVQNLRKEKEDLSAQKERELTELEGYLVKAGSRIGGDGYVLEASGGRDYKLVLSNPGALKPGDKFRVSRMVAGFGGSSEAEVGEVELLERKGLWIGRLTAQRLPTMLPEFQDKLTKK